jgi:hypothetical protein
MPANETSIVQAARAWALARAALQEIADPSEAELAIHSAADRAQAFKKAERALYQAIQKTTAPRHTSDAPMKSNSPSTTFAASPTSVNGSNGSS